MIDLTPCLEFSKKMVAARRKIVIVKEDNSHELIKECGQIMRAKNITKKIKEHVKRKDHKITG